MRCLKIWTSIPSTGEISESQSSPGLDRRRVTSACWSRYGDPKTHWALAWPPGGATGDALNVLGCNYGIDSRGIHKNIHMWSIMYMEYGDVYHKNTKI